MVHTVQCSVCCESSGKYIIRWDLWIHTTRWFGGMRVNMWGMAAGAGRSALSCIVLSAHYRSGSNKAGLQVTGVWESLNYALK